MYKGQKEDSDVKQYEFKIGLAGKTFPGMPEWSTKEPLFLTQDATNPYLFSAETNLVAGNTMEYTITLWHPDGWWPNPFWRFDAETGEEANVANGGSNMAKIPVPAPGKYRIEFDTHLLRPKLYRIE